MGSFPWRLAVRVAVCLLGILFCSEVWPVFGWRASGMNSWKGRVLSGGGLRGWGFMGGGV